jgi:plastocyanin
MRTILIRIAITNHSYSQFLEGFPMITTRLSPARWVAAGLVKAILGTINPAAAADPEFNLLIRNHRFEPTEIAVPAGQRIRLVIQNADATPEEFESCKLNREKVIPGNSKGIVYVGPLSPGTYPFFGEFHEKTAQGRLIAR